MIELLIVPGLACLLVGAMLGYLGQHVVSRGVIFVDLAIAQIAVLGTVVAAAAGFDPDGIAVQGIALIFSGVAALLFALSRSRRRGVPQEAIIGISYAVAAALTVIVLSRDPRGQEVLERMLTGSVLFAGWTDLARIAVVYALVGTLHLRFQRHFQELTERSDSAAVAPHERAWDFVFYLTFGLVVVVTVPIIGVLLVFSYLVVPAVTAAFLARGARTRLLAAWGVSGLTSGVGLWLSAVYDLPTGAVIVSTAGGMLALVALWARLFRGGHPRE